MTILRKKDVNIFGNELQLARASPVVTDQSICIWILHTGYGAYWNLPS